jgi:NAD(P)H-binding
MNKVCIVGASGKLGRYMVKHALGRGYEVVGVCREESLHKLDDLRDRITIIAGRTNDRDVIRRAVSGCDGVLTVLVPWGMDHYSSGTAQAVIDFAAPAARLVFSCGWHITRDGKDKYSRSFLVLIRLVAFIMRVLRAVYGRRPDQSETRSRGAGNRQPPLAVGPGALIDGYRVRRLILGFGDKVLRLITGNWIRSMRQGVA